MFKDKMYYCFIREKIYKTAYEPMSFVPHTLQSDYYLAY